MRARKSFPAVFGARRGHWCPARGRDSIRAQRMPGIPVRLEMPPGTAAFLLGSGAREKRQEEQREKRNSWLVNKRCSDVGEGELPWSPAFQAGWEPPAHKFLFDAGKTPDHVSLQDGENPEKNTRKEGGSCPGTPRGSRPEWLGGLGLGSTSPAPPGAPRELPCQAPRATSLLPGGRNLPCPGNKCQSDPGTPSFPPLFPC